MLANNNAMRFSKLYSPKYYIQYSLLVESMNSFLAIGPFEIHVDRAMPEMTHFCLPGLLKELEITTSTTYQVCFTNPCFIRITKTIIYGADYFVSFSAPVYIIIFHLFKINRFVWLKSLSTLGDQDIDCKKPTVIEINFETGFQQNFTGRISFEHPIARIVNIW